VGAIHAGEANNVIPATARLEISVRALDPQVRRAMEQRIRELVMLQAQSHGVRAELQWRPGYAVLVNDAQQTARALAVAEKHFPAGQVVAQGPMLTGSEDFAFMLERVPGSYLFIGNGADGEPGACMVHNPAYDFNDHNIATGAAYWIALVQDLLSPSP
jgi:hippurate hydrolase